MTETPPILAEVVDYISLLEALRARVATLDTTCESIEHVVGLQAGYATRVLSRVPQRRLEAATMLHFIQGLGCKFLLVEDPPQWAKVQGRLMKAIRRPGLPAGGATNGGQRTARKQRNRASNPFKGDSAWGRAMRLRALVLTTQGARRRAARKAGIESGRMRKLRRRLREAAAAAGKDEARC
jgi:hypothetical protein